MEPSITNNYSQKLTTPAKSEVKRNEIRVNIRAARRSISPEQQRYLGKQASAHMLSKLESLNVKSLAIYLTNDGELDTAPLIQVLWDRGIKVYLPRLHPFSKGNLLFLTYTPTTTLVQNSLKIWEPKLNINQMILLHKLDVVVTPLVTFDNIGNRMGMGGGYYDRTLANWERDGSPLPIGYAHDCQEADCLPREHWDIPLPLIITPTKMWQF